MSKVATQVYVLGFCLGIFLLGMATPIPAPATASEEAANGKREVTLEFEPILEASSYEIRVTRIRGEKSQKPVLLRTSEAVWRARMKPGKYLLEFRAIDDRGAPGDWSAPLEHWILAPAVTPLRPTAGAQIQAKNSAQEQVEFAWQDSPGASEYRLDIQDTKGEFKTTFTSREPVAKLELPVGRELFWSVVPLHPEGQEGEKWESPQAFTLLGPPLTRAKIDVPITRVVRELTWTPIDHAAAYVFRLERREPKKWRVISEGEVSQPRLAFDLSQPAGRYRLSISAKSNLRKNAPWSRLEFEAQGGLRDPAAIESAELKESLEKPTRYYAIASYLVTQIDYSGRVYDANSAPSFSAVGGTGRVGLGHQNPLSPWGWFGIVDLSGFNIAGRNFTFAAAEAHATYSLQLTQRGQTLLGAGLASKELPILRGSSGAGFQGMGKAQQYGPHVGLQYWLPWTHQFGLQMNARLYYGISGSSDVGGKIEPSPSYQLGILGSYRWSRSTMTYAGYAFRKDQVQFAADPSAAGSFAQSGDVNLVEIQGHYLNLLFEYSF